MKTIAITIDEDTLRRVEEKPRFKSFHFKSPLELDLVILQVSGLQQTVEKELCMLRRDCYVDVKPTDTEPFCSYDS